MYYRRKRFKPKKRLPWWRWKRPDRESRWEVEDPRPKPDDSRGRGNVVGHIYIQRNAWGREKYYFQFSQLLAYGKSFSFGDIFVVESFADLRQVLTDLEEYVVRRQQPKHRQVQKD